jgi:SAM-dependent methyltransferase
MHSPSGSAILIVMDRRAHWDQVYQSKKPTEVSWYQPSTERSLFFVHRLGNAQARIIDIGAGASRLVDALLDAGYPSPILLDISAAAFEHTKARLGSRAPLVEWSVADVTRDPQLPTVDVWHDRAVLHFLTEAPAQQAYARLAARTVRSGGHAIIATFAPDGPERCSGLPVTRHDGQSVSALLGPDFELLEEEREIHRTPSAAEQRFCWSILRRK